MKYKVWLEEKFIEIEPDSPFVFSSWMIVMIVEDTTYLAMNEGDYVKASKCLVKLAQACSKKVKP